MRIIKKYPNRRLYDYGHQRLHHAGGRQADGGGKHTIPVRDAKTNEELTRAILLQII